MDKVISWLQKHNIEEVQCVTADQNGIARGKVFPVNKFIAEQGFRMAESVLLQSTSGDFIDDDILYSIIDPGDIDMMLTPDSNCCYILPWTRKPTAMIIHDCFDLDGNNFDISPRNILKKVLSLYSEKDWQAVVAPEMELYFTQTCTDEHSPLQPPIGRSGRPEAGRQSFGIDAITEFEPLIADIYAWSEQQALDIDVVVHEEGAAQFEFNFNHGDPLSLADQVFLFKTTVKEAAIKHGYTATFMAKPHADQPGSAMHIHQSVVNSHTGKNIFYDENGDTDLFFNFLGGLQKYIPQIMPMFAPNVNSYRRFVSKQATPVNLLWGVENRTVGLRIPDAVGPAKRIENRLPGSDSNPYLAIAASLLCGYVGMVEKLSPTKESIGKSNKAISADLPITIEPAINNMANSAMLEKYLGERFVKAYTSTKLADYESFKNVISAWERHYLLNSV